MRGDLLYVLGLPGGCPVCVGEGALHGVAHWDGVAHWASAEIRCLRLMAGAADISGVRQIDVPHFADARGSLTPFEQFRPLPFKPARTFVIADVPAGARRAQHVVSCDQFLWMAAGACAAIVRPDAAGGAADERRFRLVARGSGLYLPEGVWLDLSDFAPGSILICLAAREYVPRA